MRLIHPGRARQSAAFALIPEFFCPPMDTTILIVEDDTILRNALGRWAVKHNLRSLEAVSAEDALELLAKEQIDLAIVDQRLPGLDGLGLARELIAQDSERPVVLMTAFADLDSAREALNIGVYEYITKPFDLEDLSLCVQRALQHRRLMLENREHREQLEAEVARRTKALENEIEERKKIEQALRDSEAQMRLIADSLPGHVAYVDTNRRYRFLNEKYEHTFGMPREEMYGKHMRDVLGNEIYDEVEPYVDRVLTGEKVEFESAFPNDDERTVFITYVPHADFEGCVQGFFVLVVEVTERKQMEARIVQLERLGALAELSEGVSHNLNNILTGILGPAQLIEFQSKDPDILQEAQIIQEAALRATDLVKRLSFSVGHEAETPMPVDAVRAVTEAIASAQPRWKDEAEANGITIAIDNRLVELPLIVATPKELQTVFLNLIFNAIDAMPDGGTVSIASVVVDDYVHIQVSDTGIGMDEEVRRRAFEPFFTTKSDVGTGLGLSSVFSAMTRWGGHIDIQSRPEEGTTVLVVLPIWQDDVSGVTQEARRAGSILIVEDEDMVRNFLQRVLDRYHHVDIVESGAEALEKFTPGKYDVAMVDLGMPEMPGDRVVELLRQQDPVLATVLITGWDLESTDARRAIFDFHLKKPFDSVDRIMDILAQAISTHDARADRQT